MKTFNGITLQTKRSKRKTVSIQVMKEKKDQILLLIKMPEYIDDNHLQQILEAKRSWILKSKAKLLMRETVKEKLLSDFSLKDDGRLPFMGNVVKLKILSDSTVPRLIVQGNDNEIIVLKNPNYLYYKQELPFILRDYYQKKAYEEFSGIIDDYSKIYGFKVKQLRIKDTKTRWGSCSAKMNINLNWKLIIAHHRVYEYVIVHELCHIGCWNHSQQFWNRVASIMPDYQSRKNELKIISELLSAFDFSKLLDGL